MKKNNGYLLAQARALEKERKRERQKLHEDIDSVTPQVYAAFAIVLSRDYDWPTEKIEELFADTQEVWAESLGYLDENICETCLRETGIEVRARA